MTDTTIHDKLKSYVNYPTGYHVTARCSCGWLSSECYSAYQSVAEEDAEELLREHQESQLQPTKGAENDTRKE